MDSDSSLEKAMEGERNDKREREGFNRDLEVSKGMEIHYFS